MPYTCKKNHVVIAEQISSFTRADMSRGTYSRFYLARAAETDRKGLVLKVKMPGGAILPIDRDALRVWTIAEDALRDAAARLIKKLAVHQQSFENRDQVRLAVLAEAESARAKTSEAA